MGMWEAVAWTPAPQQQALRTVVDAGHKAVRGLNIGLGEATNIDLGKNLKNGFQNKLGRQFRGKKGIKKGERETK